MTIGIIGWTGYKNVGDERIYYCIKKYFSHHTLIQFNGFLDAINNIQKVNSCDYILIGGGGLIFRGFNIYVPFINSIKKPFGCIGISIEANKLNKDMELGLNLLKEKSDFIYVRDHHSKSLLNDHYKVIVGPDISFLYPYKIKKGVTKEIYALNLRKWFWWNLELHGKFHNILNYFDIKYRWLESLYFFKKWSESDLVKIIKKRSRKITPLPLYFGSYDQSDFTIALKYFPNVQNRFNISSLEKSRYLIGMRLHSLIFACQLGIPFISLSYQPKNVHFCEEINMPELSLKTTEYKEIEKKIRYVKSNYGEIRKSLIQKRNEFQKETQYIFSRIQKIIEESAE